MGFVSFWLQLTGQRGKDESDQRRPEMVAVERLPPDYPKPNGSANNNRTQPASALKGPEQKRRSRGFSLSRPKSASQSRKSWFGAGPIADDDIPLVPTLPVTYSQRSEQKKSPDGSTSRPKSSVPSSHTAATRNVAQMPKDKHKSSNAAFNRTSSRDRSQSNPNKTDSKGRKSWFSSRHHAHEDVPPLPAMPVVLGRSSRREVASTPAEVQRKGRQTSLSRVMSRERRSSKASQTSTSRRSWFTSSNPDVDADLPPTPPVPALPSNGLTALPRAPQSEKSQQARPLSTQSHRSYTPKYAATAFLKSTTSSKDQKSASRRSDQAVVGLNEVSQKEWDKLKHLLEVMEKRQDNIAVHGNEAEYEQREKERRNKYANAQALAALEFGTSAK